MVSSKLLRSRTLECSPAAAMSRTWSITLILPGDSAAQQQRRTPESGAEPRIGEGSKMAAALGSFGSRRGSTPEDIGSY